jgi:hypothetical protein
LNQPVRAAHIEAQELIVYSRTFVQLQDELEQFRSSRPHWTRLPETP